MEIAKQFADPREPHLSRFKELIRQGAGTLDIHDQQDPSSSFTRPALADDALISREVDRVRVHQQSLCALLASCASRAERVLDVGCGTGATTVALALHGGLGARSILGVDPNQQSLAAAHERWKAHAYAVQGVEVNFQSIRPNVSLPFADGSFDLTTCVSVIEYVADIRSRRSFVSELLRVTRKGGQVCLVTPSPFRLFDYHTHRLLGDWRRTSGYPWASTPWELARIFGGHEVRFLLTEQLRHGLERRRLPPLPGLFAFGRALGWLLPWQKLLVTKC